MAVWDKITEFREDGYYIGWHRLHPEIHESRKPPYVKAKHSLVQIGGKPGLYEVLGQTVMRSVFARPGEKRREVVFKKVYMARTLTEAQQIATRLKRGLAKQFDKLSRD